MRRISSDEARLRPHLRSDCRNGKLPATAPLDDVLEAEAEHARRQRERTVVPAAGDLRGVPVVGSGPGAIRGTNPAAALIAKDERRRR
jgi:hypothetical protein